MNELATSLIIIFINGLVLSGISLRFLGVAFTFTIINFVLLLVLGGYVFVKYFLPKIKGDILAHRQTRKKMKQHAHDLGKEKKDLAEGIEDQKEYIKSLDLKLKAWETHFNRAKAKRTKEKKEITRIMHDRVQKQFEYMEADYTRELILPDAIKEAQKELVAQFSDPKAGKVFLADVIKRMNQEAK